jgi:acetylornithine deacetylase/succinyl-diaminopimelate desuccinylase-like protein
MRVETMNRNTKHDIYKRPVELLQQLIRFDTTNPPGNERACIEYIDGLLKDAGIKTQLLYKDKNRPNLVARLAGKPLKEGGASPLLLFGHVDVVHPGTGPWTYPPFEGKIANGFIWGRGALDMKGAIAMMVSALIKAKAEHVELSGDVILCVLSDEEEGGEYGSKFLVENHAHLFEWVRFALGEFGGFSLYVGGKKFYPIQVSEKQKCSIRAIFKGPAGHGAFYVKDGAMAKMGEMLKKLNDNLLPVHITPAVEAMFRVMSKALGFPSGSILKRLLKPGQTDFVLKRLLGEKGAVFVPLFRNIVNATIVRGGGKLNVIPDRMEVDMDVRILPGFTPEDVIDELRPIIGHNVELKVLEFDPGPARPDMGMFDTLAAILEEADPLGTPVPLMISGNTDGRIFSRLGIQTYGFVPMQLPKDINFNRAIHSVDERVPVNTIQYGRDLIFEALLRR